MRWHAPVDPECPEVSQFRDSLLNDPMTHAMGAPIDDILEGFDSSHRARCERCQEYGAANVEVMRIPR